MVHNEAKRSLLFLAGGLCGVAVTYVVLKHQQKAENGVIQPQRDGTPAKDTSQGATPAKPKPVSPQPEKTWVEMTDAEKAATKASRRLNFHATRIPSLHGKTSLPLPEYMLKRGVTSEEPQTENLIMGPYTYITKTPGKGVRDMLIDAFHLWLKVPPDVLKQIKTIIGQLHNASLLIDDIEDGSHLRRGVPVAHKIYGMAQTINCANYVYFQAMESCRRLDNDKALHLFIKEMLNLHRGQGLDIYWRDNLVCPGLEDYQSMVIDKTGGVFRLAYHLLNCFSDNNENYVPLCNLLGLFFQMRDDYCNLKSEEYEKNKSFAEDITEGKYSFPIIHCIQAQQGDPRLLSILKQHTHDVELKRAAIQFMEDAGSFECTRVALAELRDQIRTELERLGGNVIIQGIMEKLCKDIWD